MATTTRPRPTAGRNRDRASGGAPRSGSRGSAEEQYDLLTAAVLGAAVGATLALVATGMRSEPSGLKVIRMPKGMKAAGKATRKGARLVAEGAGAAMEHVSADALREYLDGARQAIDGVVEEEVRGLKRAIRRRRKKLGL